MGFLDECWGVVCKCSKWVFFHNYSISLCPFISVDNWDHRFERNQGTMIVDSCDFVAVFNNVIFLSCCVCVSYLDFSGCNYLFIVFSWVYLISLGFSFLSSAFCRVGVVERHCLKLDLSQMTFSCFAIGSCVWYSSHWCHLSSLWVCKISVQILLVCGVSFERLPSYIASICTFRSWTIFFISLYCLFVLS